MTPKTVNIQPLHIKDCVLLNIATGVRAQNVKELMDALATIHPRSIIYHFWNKKLRPSFEEPEYNNDFASWAYNNLHDNRLAERLSLINPVSFPETEDLRKKLIEVLDFSIEENQSNEDSKESEKFQFTHSEVVTFDTDIVVNKPEEFSNIVNELSLGSIYYHFIYTNDPSDNIIAWLAGFGDKYKDLTLEIINLDPYFFTLDELRSRSAQVFKDNFKGAPN